MDENIEPASSDPMAIGRGRSPAVAAGLSFLWPGLGQLFLGRRLVAATLGVPALLIAIVALVQLNQGALMFAVSLWDPSYFVAVALVVIGFGVLRVVAVGHAFLIGSRRQRPSRGTVAFVALLLAIIVATHGLLVAGTWAWYETSVSIQNSDFFAVASASAPPALSNADATPTPADTPSYEPSLTNQPTATPTRVPNPNRITFLLIGSDFMTGRDHSLTDTMMLVSIDRGTRKVAIVSVPRDTSSFDLYYGGAVVLTFKLNTLLSAAVKASFGSPDPPMKTLENEIGFLVGVPVNYYAEVDLNGFSKMIDALGGIDVVNQRAINDPATGIVMAAGPVHLDGATAMLYVRSRENGGSDYLRAARQQALLVAIERKATSPAGLLHLGTLLSLTGETIATDFPLSTARTYVSLAQHVSRIESCVLGPPYSSHPDTATTGGTWTSRLDLARVANLSVEMFGEDSRYYGQPGVASAVCGK
jgi:polyisoprenyl-teichoic acid--peptidoglycan teichoic acid transferase